jgi:DnaJ-class molecular chaperone
LNERERQALDWLRCAGACALTERFTAVELKSAFRALARRFHPDAQPGVDEWRRQELAESFRRLTAAYRALRAVLASG